MIDSNNVLQVLGPRLKKARHEKRLTQEFVAESVNISADLLRNIENGRNFPSFITLENIMRVLNVGYFDVFQFAQYVPADDLIQEITTILKDNPERVKDAYKIIKALVD